MWTTKHVKRPGLRKNAPLKAVSSEMECCRKHCLKNFSDTHLFKLRNEFAALYYEQQTAYLNGLLRRHEPKPSSGHKRNPKLTSAGKPLGRPPADKSKFTFEYYVRSEKNIDVKVCRKGFCLIHGFTPKRLQVLRRKIEQSTGEATIELDRRGKHKNHPKVGEDVRELR